MPHRSMAEVFEAIGDNLLNDYDAITREAHVTYRAYDPAVLIEHDVRAQATCTYSHMVASADKRFVSLEGVRPIEIRGLKLWLFEHANIVVRFKKMDEDGRSRSYPTKQAKAFYAQLELPGLPPKPLRLTVGYLLDKTGTQFIRTQIARPDGRDAMWCGAIVPEESRRPGERIWVDVTRQARF